jgi:outer membrane protein, heavy metal efflux system
MDKKYFVIISFVIASSFACSVTPEPESKKPISNSLVTATFSRASIKKKEIFQSIEPAELSLPQALALTLERSPELKSFSHTVRVNEARIIQASLIPNPELSFQVEDAFGPFGSDSYSQATLQLSQIVELGDKRAARTDVARAISEQSSNDYEVKRVEVLTNLTEKFIRTSADEHLLKLARKGEELARHGLQNILKRSLAGGASELEEAKARVLVARSHITAEHVEHELNSSKRELVSYWGSENPKFSKISSNLFQSIALPSFQELDARIDQSLEIKKWVTEKRLREAEKKLAEAKSIPNLTISAGPRHIESMNDDSFVFQFSVPLNIFDRNQGARKEASILSDKVALDETTSRLRLKTALFGLFQEAKHAMTQLELMKKEIIPQAKKSLRIAQDGYDQGRFSYLDLLDAQRTLLDVLHENIEAAYSLHSYSNSIERLLGAPLKNEPVKQN